LIEPSSFASCRPPSPPLGHSRRSKGKRRFGWPSSPSS
jgi:hypothetical protein